MELDNVTVKGVPIACSTHKRLPIVLRQKINIGPKSARGTQRNKNKSAQNRPMTYEGLNTQWRCKISKLMVANWVNGYLRHVNRQLMPWNFQIQYSYLHSNAILNIKMYSCIFLGLKITQIKFYEMLLTTFAHKQRDVIWRLPVWNVKIRRFFGFV